MTLTPEREQQLLALIGRVEELERKRCLEELPEIATDGIVFPGKSKYNGLDDFINNTMSSGLISGCTVTDNSDGTVAVTAGYGYIRKTSSNIGELLAFSVPADSSVDLTDDDLNYVYVDYNGGNPTISYTVDVTSLDHTSQFVIALVYQESDHAHIAHAGQHLNNFIHNVYYYLWEVAGKERASGLVVSEDASEDRALNMTAGVLYWALQRLSVSALDTSTDGDNDEMTLFYRAAPSGWTEVTAQHVIPNTQYDDGSGTLQDLTPNRYGVYWVYVTIDGELYVQYGQGDYTLAQAEAAAAPDTMTELNSVGVLIAKIIIQESATNFYEVYLPWSADIGSTPATDHGGLAGLGDDDHTQYIKHALSTAANDFLVGSGSNTFIKKTLAETGAILEGDIDHGNLQGLDTGADHSYIDQDVTSGSSPTFDGTNFTGIPDGAMDTDYVEVAGDQMDGALTIDVTGTEALLVRQNADAADVLIVDTTNSDVEVKQLKFIDGGSTVDIIRDEDDMSSDDAAALATQQSIKAYVDAQGTNAVNCVTVYRTSDQTIANQTYTKLQFDNEESDDLNEWDASTDYDFVPAANGTYHIGLNVRWRPQTGRQQIVIYLNGVAAAVGETYNAETYPTVYVATTLELTTSDAITFYVYHNCGGNESILGAKTSTYGQIVRLK